MVDYRAYTLTGHLWLPQSREPDFVYTRQVEDALARMRINAHVRVAEHPVETAATLDQRLDEFVPPWLLVDQMWADKFIARAQTNTEQLLYKRLLRSHYHHRYDAKRQQ